MLNELNVVSFYTQKTHFQKAEPTKESAHIIRLLSFVEGKIMHEIPTTPKLLEKAGKYIARIESIIKVG